MYLEVELKAFIRSYRFFFCEGLHTSHSRTETDQQQVGAQLVPIGIPYILSIKLRTKSNINIVQKINKCICHFLTSP